MRWFTLSGRTGRASWRTSQPSTNTSRPDFSSRQPRSRVHFKAQDSPPTMIPHLCSLHTRPHQSTTADLNLTAHGCLDGYCYTNKPWWGTLVKGCYQTILSGSVRPSVYALRIHMWTSLCLLIGFKVFPFLCSAEENSFNVISVVLLFFFVSCNSEYDMDLSDSVFLHYSKPKLSCDESLSSESAFFFFSFLFLFPDVTLWSKSLSFQDKVPVSLDAGDQDMSCILRS